MFFSQEEILNICEADLIQQAKEALYVKDVLLDSREFPLSPEENIFFAISGDQHDGHHYIQDAYQKGIRSFVVEHNAIPQLKEANVFLVKSSLEAFHKLCFAHREKFNFPVLGITGSNGKTIIKEWLHSLLDEEFNLVKSPKSFNSKIGVPLSIKQFNSNHNFGIIEVGISHPGDMDLHRKLVHPDLGIFCHFGDAHQMNFQTAEHKALEKVKLFASSKEIIYCEDQKIPSEAITKALPKAKKISWSEKNTKAAVYVTEIVSQFPNSQIKLKFEQELYEISIPFIDRASIENAIYCFTFLAARNLLKTSVLRKFMHLSAIDMRLELQAGINRCQLINDSYSNDPSSLNAALNYLFQFDTDKSLILSDFEEVSGDKDVFYRNLAKQIGQLKLKKVIGIGTYLEKYQSFFSGESFFFDSAEQFLQQFDFGNFSEETILIKGSRKFQLESINQRLQEKIHLTRLEINLNNLRDNLNFFRSKIPKGTQVMAMVKAFSYGAGSVEVAQELVYNRVDYLTVAYLSEGVELRNAGIQLPIMVLNSRSEQVEQMMRYRLEPEIFSFELLEAWQQQLKSIGFGEQYPVHIKIDTGMKRLGFDPIDIPKLVELLKKSDLLKIRTVFSHLASSDDLADSDFSLHQIKLFKESVELLKSLIDQEFLSHILNSAGALNYPEGYCDMVRLGIGLYGVSNSPESEKKLLPVSKLISHISQIRNIKKGESIGYNRRHIAETDMKIAIVPIGYADGLMRCLGNGRANLIVAGQACPIIGSICMDMTMIDISHVQAETNDEVIVFGPEQSIETLAKAANTIAYEVLTGISERVPRVYIKA